MRDPETAPQSTSSVAEVPTKRVLLDVRKNQERA